MAVGVNTAENHPISMKWIERARERGAKLICIDPRLTRTAAVADIWLPLRPGTDIALLGGLINYTLSNIQLVVPVLGRDRLPQCPVRIGQVAQEYALGALQAVVTDVFGERPGPLREVADH